MTNPATLTADIINDALNDTTIFVVASYKQHLDNWCEENLVNPRHPNVKHIYRKEHFMGIRNVPMFLAYGWWEMGETQKAVFDYCAMNGLRETDLPRSLTLSDIRP